MGRPLNDKFFGDVASSGSQIRVSAVVDSGVGVENCYIMSQKGSKTYMVAAEANHSRTGRVILQEATPANVGEAQLNVVPADGSGGVLTTEHAKYLESHIVKTWEGNIYEWYVGVSASTLDAGQSTVSYA